MSPETHQLFIIDTGIVDNLYLSQGTIGLNSVCFALGDWRDSKKIPAFFSYYLFDELGIFGSNIGGILYPDLEDAIYGGETLDWRKTSYYSINATNGNSDVFSEKIRKSVSLCLETLHNRGISSVVLPLMGKGDFIIDDSYSFPAFAYNKVAPVLSSEQAAHAMLSGIKDFSNKNPASVMEITVFFPGDPEKPKETPVYWDFLKVFRNFYASPLPARPLSFSELIAAAQKFPTDKFRVRFTNTASQTLRL